MSSVQRYSLFWKTLRDMRWQVVWYGLGLCLMAALVVFIYPSYRGQLADFEIPEALRGFLGESADYASPEGFLSAEIFSWVPILLVIFAIMQGTKLLGGEESDGTMDLLLAQPVSRTRVLLEKLGAFAAGAAAIAAITYLAFLLSVPFVDIDISQVALLVATANLVPLTWGFGAFAVWASVVLPTRQQATGLVTAVAVVTFFVNYLASIVDILRPARWLSPFHYANTANVLGGGIDWPLLAVLLGLTALFAVLALRAFERRDIGIRTAAPWWAGLRRHAAEA
jgi:ABC-2 type transport system permease protein